MWHEARKHEKKLRGLMVDYRRRAERRREFYEKIRGDPASFLQIHGTQLKIHIDPNISQAAENSLMPWMGNKDNLIDRFDVRAHLDYISPLCDANHTTTASQSQQTDVSPQLDRQINYERYRNLVQNEFLGLTESKYLQQIWLEERFGMNQTQKEQQQKLLTKKKLAEKKATIAYNYEDEDSSSYTVQQHTKPNDSSESEESSDEDYDFDTSVNIDQLNNEMGHRINSIAHKFGMKNDDFIRYLDQDKTEAEKIKLAKELENEKSMFTGRKSRRERRALKEQRLLILRASNFDDTTDRYVDNKEHIDACIQSSSDSEVSVDETKVEFITSFGGSSEDDNKAESQEKKQKHVITKRKQKIKDILQEKIDSTPVVYGPTLPGEEMNSSSHNIASFNRNSSSRKRSYRYNHSSDSANSRSRSRSYDRKNHSFSQTSKRFNRSRRTRSRSLDAKHSPQMRDSFRRNISKDYQRRSRSPRNSTRNRRRSRSGNRSRIRDRSRERSNQKTRIKSRSRSFTRNRSRSRTRRNHSNDRHRRRSGSHSNSKRKRSESRSKRHRSRSRSESRSRSQRSKARSTYKSRMHSRSKSKSVDIKKTTVKSITEDASNSKIENIESFDQTFVDRHKLMSISPVDEIFAQVISEDKIFKPEIITPEVDTNKADKKLPSPPMKSYYRHDLCNTSSEDENEIIYGKDKLNSDEGSKKSTISSANTCGYKLSSNMTPQERLKKKMQALIDKQYKLDKKAELEKLEKQEQERVDREEELREMTYRLKYRRDAYHRCRNSRSLSRSRSRSRSSSSSSSSSSQSSSSSSSY